MWLPVIEQAQPATGEEPKSTQLREVIVEFGRHLDILSERATLESIDCTEPVRSILRDSCLQIGESLQTAVVALQYHDRLSQRLGLVRVGLNRLQTLLHDASPRSYDDWLASLREVEHINRMEQQRLGPTPVESEASVYEPDLSQSSVELF